MKNIYLSVIFIVLTVSVNVTAQSKVHLLLKAGGNYSSITNLEKYERLYNDPLFDINVKSSWLLSGINISAGLEWNITRKFALESSVGYSEYGVKFTFGYDCQYTIGHLQVPLLAKYYLYEGLNVFAGPQVGYKVMTKEKPGITISLFNRDIYYSCVAGLGYQFDFGLTLTVNYVHGLTAIDNYGIPEYHTGDVPSLNAQCRAFQFNIGWKF